jgi:hypothetical protein
MARWLLAKDSEASIRSSMEEERYGIPEGSRCHAETHRKPETDLYRKIAHGTGQTILREALLVADHNSYHLGQFVLLRRLLEGGLIKLRRIRSISGERS